jgi:hypothetical protein
MNQSGINLQLDILNIFKFNVCNVSHISRSVQNQNAAVLHVLPGTFQPQIRAHEVVGDLCRASLFHFTQATHPVVPVQHTSTVGYKYVPIRNSMQKTERIINLAPTFNRRPSCSMSYQERFNHECQSTVLYFPSSQAEVIVVPNNY